MPEQTIPPYAHPTTVVMVDDNDMFLQTLDLRMPADMAYLLFHNPREALNQLNQRPTLAPISDRCISAASIKPMSDAGIRLDVSLIEEEIHNMGRFRRISVVIVDYAMPSMNGLEFCDQIANPGIKTILMTGASDEQLAVDAFNEGRVDQYVPKSRRNTLELVIDGARQLQIEYFFDQQRAIQEALAIDPPAMLCDPVVTEYFVKLRSRYRFVEHYLVDDPPGFVLLTGQGAQFRLLVLRDSEVTQQVEYAARRGAPLDVVQAIATRSRIGFFVDCAESWPEEPYPWHDFLFEPTLLQGKQKWWVALIDGGPSNIDFDPEVSSFQAYLDELDSRI